MNHPPNSPRTLFAQIFISPDEPRLRAGWRVLAQAAFTLALFFVTGELLFAGNLFLSQFASLFAITLSVFLARRLLDRRSITSLGLAWNRQAVIDLLAGLGITLILMGGIYWVEWQLGWLHFEGYAWQKQPAGLVLTHTLTMFVLYTLVGWNEELPNRGYWLQNIESGLSLPWGVAISSVFFALLHLGNPNVSWTGIFGLLLAGLFLAYGYIRTRQLWLPIGLHIGWNFFEGTVFGFPVSGLPSGGLLTHTITGPTLFTGGAFGPEAGLIIIPALLLGSGMIYLLTKGRKKSS